MSAIVRPLHAGVLLALVLTGCSGGPPQGGRVTGTVTLDGKPLSRCLVILASETSDVVRQGTVGTDGTFTVLDIPPGKYKVAVRPRQYSEDDFDIAEKGRRVPKRGVASPAVPVRYQDTATSNQTVEVRRGEELKVALTSP